MGVNGLWTVVQPCARPTNLGTLNRKRLAVDASIWIYQFLKAVRDKEGNALRNSHVVGFFRRICKLLWFGIQPVFVFDGGAPALKRATIQGRKQRREGRRDDAVRTAGKLLAVQMQRLAQDEEDQRKRDRERGITEREEQAQQEEIPEASKLVYVDEIGMSQQERQQTRKFHKQDAYHLPELDGGIAAMGKPDDPRIMSVEELEEYARQFNNGEDVNLYDFSKIDFDGDFFKSLPPPDRYNILNAARLRSRLRMGYSKEQLDDMFPDRMAFSRFQIERVKERNHLTQRLMYEVGMTGTDLTIGVNARVAGEKDREYILVKNDGVEGGWALGVVSKEKDVGEEHKPIDVDAIEFQYQSKEAAEEDEDDDFEDVPIEGVNRLPKPTLGATAGHHASRHTDNTVGIATDDNIEGSLFVGGKATDDADLFGEQPTEAGRNEEQDDINRAIALSLQNQHELGSEASEDEQDFEDVPVDAPEWTQKPAETSRPIQAHGGSMIAHIVNNRASAAVPKRQEEKPEADSDSDEDMQAVLARSRKMKKPEPKPVGENKKNPFDGPLPFPKLDWKSSLFAKNPLQTQNGPLNQENPGRGAADDEDRDEAGGGFEAERQEEDGPRPLPPWLADQTDIRENVKRQREVDRGINAEDKAEAEEEERLRRRDMRNRMIHIDDSSDSGSDVEIVEAPAVPKRSQDPLLKEPSEDRTATNDAPAGDTASTTADDKPLEAASQDVEEEGLSPEPVFEQVEVPHRPTEATQTAQAAPSTEGAEDGKPAKAIQAETEVKASSPTPEPEFEDVPALEPTDETTASTTQPPASDSVGDVAPMLETSGPEQPVTANDDDDLFADIEYDEFSDPGDEELLAQMAEEAEEHARFASELNNKSAQQNQEEYERELRALRGQQKKDRRDADEVTQVMITECQALLRLFGIPYITAPMEAEAQCAELVKLGLVDGIVTDDSDTFLFGGTRVYKNMFNSNKFVECYLSADLDKELSLSREQLISLAQLLGSDYTEGLSGVGPVTAVEILSEFPGKDGLAEFREWWKAVQSQSRPKEADASSPFRKKFRRSQATKLFLPPSFPNPAVHDAYTHPEVDASAESFQWGVPDVEGLRRFLMATIGWSKERTDEVLVPVIRDMNRRDVEGTQSNITRFFSGGVGAGARDAYAPRQQRAQGSKRMAAAVDRLKATTAADGDGTRKRRRRNGSAVEGEE